MSIDIRMRQIILKFYNFVSEGNVKVYVTTSGAPNSGTNDHVTLTVYGAAGNSGPLSLGDPDKGHFQPGQTDEFQVSENGFLVCLQQSEAIRVFVCCTIPFSVQQMNAHRCPLC